MGEAIGQTLALAFGVALSPFPIVAVILMLFTPKARTNGLAFAAGWFVGILVVGGVVLAVGGQMSDSPDSTASGVVKLVLGLGLLLLAVRNWQKRPKTTEDAQMPKWMSAIDSFTPAKAAGMAAALSGLNPKNLLLTAAAAATVSSLGLPTGQEAGWLIIFAVLASLTVAAPVALLLVMGNRADAILSAWKTWLAQNNTVVMAVLLLLLGIKLIGDGISILAA